MCGIHLRWGKEANESAINQMSKSSAHRGPDQQATISPWPELWLAVNRLKVIYSGPEADQPLWAPDGKSLLIWNGEIYNFRELRIQLAQMGTVFNSQSDTEVLLQSLQLYGEKCLKN
jgi:asparagine synthase (glutamine-hydrolysing)